MKTERLCFRPWELTDVDEFFEMHQNPNMNRFLRNPIHTKGEAKAYLEKVITEYKTNGIGRYAVILKETNTLIGFSGLKFRRQKENEYVNFYDLGYRFSERYWGKGYATEAALFWIAFGFNQLKLDQIQACAEYENTPSNAVLKKIGFTFSNSYYVNNKLHNWYTITKDDYTIRNTSPTTTSL